MYVCVCNGITDRDVRCAIREKGACSVGGVHRCMGTAPMCGKCSVQIRDMVAKEMTPSFAGTAAALPSTAPIMAMAGAD